MKKKIVLLLAMLASMTTAFADGIVSITNVQNAVPGYTGSFDIVLNESNTQTFRAYQLDLQLPEGLTYSSYTQGELLTTHQTTVSDQAENTTRFSGNANPNADFTATSGTLLTVYFTVASTATGTPTASLKNISFAKTDNSSQPSDDATGDIAIGNTITLSEDATTAPAAISNVNVTVKRTLKADVWNTIVLPFDVPAEKIATVFGEGTQIGSFDGCDYNLTTKDIKVNFFSVDAITAHIPYIIKVAAGKEEFNVEGVNITAATNGLKSEKENEYSLMNTMQGTYTPVTVPDKGLILSNNEFVFSKGKSKLKDFRAYFSFPQAKYANARMKINVINNTTKVSDVKAKTTDGKVYNLSGYQSEMPAKGFYIKDGKIFKK